MSSLLSIASVHEFPTRYIELLLEFNQADLDLDVFVELTLVMRFEGSRLEWLLNFNKSLYGPEQAIENWFDLLKLV